MLILEVTSENVAKIWFAYNFYKQHLLHVKLHRHNEKNRGFHLILKTPFQWMNPKVIVSYTFNQSEMLLETTKRVCIVIKYVNQSYVIYVEYSLFASKWGYVRV